MATLARPDLLDFKCAKNSVRYPPSTHTDVRRIR